MSNYADIHSSEGELCMTSTLGMCYCGLTLKYEPRTFYRTLFQIPLTQIQIVKKYDGVDGYCPKHGSFNEVNVKGLR